MHYVEVSRVLQVFRQYAPYQPLAMLFSLLFNRWVSSVGATERSLRLKRTGKTVMKAGTGWKRITETYSGQGGGPRGAKEIRNWVRKDPIARGLAGPATPVAPGPSVFHMWKRRIFSIFFGDLIFFCGWGSRKQASEVTEWTGSRTVDGDPHPSWDVETA